jgi:hypothetical protein
MLHRKVRATFHDLENDNPFAAGRYERQADRFAGAFLMPGPLLERELLQICTDRRLDRRTCIVEMMLATPESEYLWRKCFLPEITQRFAVSLTSALIRCRELRLRAGDERPLLSALLAERLRQATAPDSAGSIVLVEGKPKRPKITQGFLF